MLEYHFNDPPLYKVKQDIEKQPINEEDQKIKYNQVSSDSYLKYKIITPKEKKKIQAAAKELEWLNGSNFDFMDLPYEISLDV